MRIENQCKGVRIIVGDEAKERRLTLNKMISIVEALGFNEITLPTIEPLVIYTDKAGEEIKKQMYFFQDKGSRDICLRPEGTATIQEIADTHYKGHKDVKFWYFERCYRYEQPQAGRYREFFQFGVEVINPSSPTIKQELIDLAKELITLVTDKFEVNESVKRGLAYYTEEGFEISCPELGAQKQICGGGTYAQGIGFAIGFDRLMLCK